jgi:hypothetical protein
MSYGIIRVRNLKQSDLNNSEIHNARLYEQEGITQPDNIDPQLEGRYGYNQHNNILNSEETDKSLHEVIKERFNQANVKPRKNSVYAIEYVLALSPDCKESYENNYDASGMLSNLTDFVREKHGKDNVVSISKHFDESNPHVHMIVTPIREKEKKWKNRYGEGKKKVNALSARDFTGGPDKLRKLQQEFYEFVKPYERRLNKTFYRGTYVEHQKKQYVRQTDQEIGKLRAKLATIETEADKIKVKEEIKQKQQEFEQKTNELDNKIEKRKKANKGDKWTKKQEFFDKPGKQKETQNKEPMSKKETEQYHFEIKVRERAKQTGQKSMDDTATQEDYNKLVKDLKKFHVEARNKNLNYSLERIAEITSDTVYRQMTEVGELPEIKHDFYAKFKDTFEQEKQDKSYLIDEQPIQQNPKQDKGRGMKM